MFARRARSCCLCQRANAVDSVIAELRPLIDKGDLIIDAGNGNFHNTREPHENARG